MVYKLGVTETQIIVDVFKLQASLFIYDLEHDLLPYAYVCSCTCCVANKEIKLHALLSQG